MTDQAKPSIPKTELQSKIEARRPHERKIAMKGFPGLESQEIVLRLLRKGAMNDALAAAHARIERLCEKSPTLRENAAFVKEQETIAMLFSAARDAKDPNGLPAFLSPEWMEQNFDTAEFEYLLRAYNAFAGEVHPDGSQHLGPDKLAPFLDWIASQADSDAINAELLLFRADMLGEALIRAAVMLREANRAADDLKQRLDAFASAGFIPPDDGDGIAAVSETLSIFGTRLLAEEHANDLLANAAPRIRTARDAELAMSMLGWKEGSPAWKRVLGEEGGGRSS